MITLHYGPVINPHTLTRYFALPRCLIAVGPDGNIIWMEEDIDRSVLHDTVRSHGLTKGGYTLVDVCQKPGEFIMPGLIDTHVHAGQFPLLGIGGELELLDWLREYAFPQQRKFADNVYAERVYEEVVDRSIASGTTTSCYYGTSHLDATIILADIIHKKGQRAFVGVLSSKDRDCPDEQSPECSLSDTIKFIEYVRSLPPVHANEPLVYPTIVPTFRNERLPTDLGKLAASMPHVPIQVHISENRKDISEMLERFGDESYAAIYDRFGLLRNNTILGHGVWLTEKELTLIAKRGAGVAHCPTSNFYLSSGMAKVGSLLDHGIKVGLGTDVSGGYNPSLLYTVQMASATSKMVFVQSQLDDARRKHSAGERHAVSAVSGASSDTASDRAHEEEDADDARNPFTHQKLGVETLLYLATLGGAHVCCLQDRIGAFAVGKAFDALHVSIHDACRNPAVWGAGVDEREREINETNLRRWLERFLFGGDNRNVRRVFVQGTVVGGADTDLGWSARGDACV